jgi:sialate O-acetylesterase
MVLQSAPDSARLWGWTAGPSQTVTVKVGDGIQVKKAVSSSVAPYFWSVDLDPIAASFNSYAIGISSDASSVVLQNILFGQVFLCSGQSNMQMSVAAAFNATQVCFWCLIRF